MSEITLYDRASHEQLLAQLQVLLQPGETLLTHMANMSALLYWSLPDLNWVGFYLRNGDQLHLGPFQGKPACTVLPIGNGVCGTAVRERRTLHVPDVHAFPGHIACDSASNAEVVVPVLHAGEVWAVLDVDSPVKNRFTDADVRFLEAAASHFQRRCEAAGGQLFTLDKA